MRLARVRIGGERIEEVEDVADSDMAEVVGGAVLRPLYFITENHSL